MQTKFDVDDIVYAPMTIPKITMAQNYTTPDYVEEIGSSPAVATKI